MLRVGSKEVALPGSPVYLSKLAPAARRHTLFLGESEQPALQAPPPTCSNKPGVPKNIAWFMLGCVYVGGGGSGKCWGHSLT